MIPKVPQAEYEKTDSKYSAMRKAFFWMVKFGIVLTSFIVVAIIGISIANSFLTKPIDIPIAALLGLPGIVFGAGFAGKAAQSFSEPNDPIFPQTQMTAPYSNTLPKETIQQTETTTFNKNTD